MILFVREADRVREYFAPAEGCGFDVLDQEAFIYEIKGSWKVRLPESLIPDPDFVPADMNMLRLGDSKGRCAYLILVDGDENWKEYDCYRLPEGPFQIGSSRSDTIVYEHELISAAAWNVDPQTMTVSAAADEMLFISGRAVMTPYRYQYGDMIELYGLRIILLHDCLLINRMKQVSVRLDPFNPDHASPAVSHCGRMRYERIPFAMPAPYYEIRLDPPRQVARVNRNNLLLSIGPSLMMGFASLTSGLLSFYNGYEKGRDLIEMIPSLMFPVMMLVSALLWSPLQRLSEKRRHRQEIRERDQDYEAYLSRTNQSAKQFREKYSALLDSVFPKTDAFLKECTETDILKIPDCPQVFVRMGMSSDVLKIAFSQREGMEKDDSGCTDIEEFRRQICSPQPVPYLLDLSAYPRITIENAGAKIADDLLMQICLRTHPDDIGIVLMCPEKYASERSWLADLPHLYAPQGNRLMAFSMEEAEDLLSAPDENGRRMILFNLLSRQFMAGEYCSQICFADHSDLKCDLKISWSPDQCHVSDFLSSHNLSFAPDHCEHALTTLAQRLPRSSTSAVTDRSFSFLEMHGCASVDDLQIEKRWQTSNINKGICSLIGCGSDGEDIILDLYEKKDGPHGLIAGTTGSGKSELILTMILSLAISYPPEDLQLILIDFKGGSSMNSLYEGDQVLPHITGTLSNLDNDDMHRVIEQFSLECRKREGLQKKLSSLCNEPVMNASDYRRMWKEEYGLEWMCELIIIVDEFAQLKAEQPEFLSQLINIARIGRSLGIHLILATQKPAGVVTDQIWSNTRFKICLKVSETQDSIEMIKRKDAAYIRDPGVFFLLADERYVCGRSGYVQCKSEIIDTSVVIYDLAGRIVRDSASLHAESEPEIKRIIRKILQIQKDRKPVQPLWKPRLMTLERRDLQKAWAFACVDDWHHNCYTDLILHSQAVHAFISSDLHEKRNLTRVIADTVMRFGAANDEIVLVDDLKAAKSPDLKKSPLIADIFSARDEEAVISLLQLMAKRSESDSRLFVLINDLSAFYELNPSGHDALMKAASRCQEKNLTLILIASGAAAFNYRDLPLLTYRYVLKGVSQQETAGFFETSGKPPMCHAGHGLMAATPLQEFCLYSCSAEDLVKTADESLSKKRSQPKSEFLHMPQRIRLADCRGSGIPLGIVKKNCRWLVIRKEKVCIAAADSEQLAEFEQLYAQHGYEGDHVFPSEKQLTFVVFDQLRDFDSPKHQDTVFLFLHDAFLQQYRVTRRIAKKENESVLFCRNRTEVIRTAEE